MCLRCGVPAITPNYNAKMRDGVKVDVSGVQFLGGCLRAFQHLKIPYVLHRLASLKFHCSEGDLGILLFYYVTSPSHAQRATIIRNLLPNERL
jgi:hypothetical protein